MELHVLGRLHGCRDQCGKGGQASLPTGDSIEAWAIDENKMPNMFKASVENDILVERNQRLTSRSSSRQSVPLQRSSGEKVNHT